MVNLIYLFLFLTINLVGLGISSALMGKESKNPWYKSMKKAPWHPPAGIFGVAWVLIMILLAIFMWKATQMYSNQALIGIFVLYALQWGFGILWNSVFFRIKSLSLGLVTISLHAISVLCLFIFGYYLTGSWAWLLAPYVIWIFLAASLNAYMYRYNQKPSPVN